MTRNDWLVAIFGSLPVFRHEIDLAFGTLASTDCMVI